MHSALAYEGVRSFAPLCLSLRVAEEYNRGLASNKVKLDCLWDDLAPSFILIQSTCQLSICEFHSFSNPNGWPFSLARQYQCISHHYGPHFYDFGAVKAIVIPSRLKRILSIQRGSSQRSNIR
jgi:hypothetical protein